MPKFPLRSAAGDQLSFLDSETSRGLGGGEAETGGRRKERFAEAKMVRDVTVHIVKDTKFCNIFGCSLLGLWQETGHWHRSYGPLYIRYLTWKFEFLRMLLLVLCIYLCICTWSCHCQSSQSPAYSFLINSAQVRLNLYMMQFIVVHIHVACFLSSLPPFPLSARWKK
jgi:hypothetical protein